MFDEWYVPNPDWMIADLSERLADYGPRYRETPADPFAASASFPAEPWNTATASLFVLIVLFWTWRLHGRYRQFPFLTGCLPILLAGGLGGTLYHATRTSKLYFFLDMGPIMLLGLAAAVYLAVRLGRELGLVRVGGMCVGLVSVYIGVNYALRLWPNPPANIPINVNYASLAAVLMVPLLWVLARTQFRHSGWVLAGVASFAHGWFCRLADNTSIVNLPMGTHWLWHLYGAAAVMFMTEYFYRLARDDHERDSSTR